MSNVEPPTLPPDEAAHDFGTSPGRRSGNALPAGTRLAEFEIRGVIGEGGFGIVYRARDLSLQREVAIKEYMPASLAARARGSRVTALSDKVAETFDVGLKSFVNEAHLLASFDHPSLLKVHRFWEANGTAYMVMPLLQGVTLKKALLSLGAPPQEGWLLMQLRQLLDALEVMHDAQCFHRDIAPDNILLLDDGRPLLLDFGAARRVIGDRTHALTAFLKPGYAPVEQYAEMPSMTQGAWTDLYALGSVLHYAITGHTPPESVARLIADTMVPLAKVAAGRYSDRFLRAIDHALAVRPEDRTQSVTQMRIELGIEDRRQRTRGAKDIPTAPGALDVDSAHGNTTLPPPARTSGAEPSRFVVPLRVAATPSRRSSTRLALGAVIVLAAMVALGLAWLRPKNDAPPAAATVNPGAVATRQPLSAVPDGPAAPPAATPVVGPAVRHATGGVTADPPDDGAADRAAAPTRPAEPVAGSQSAAPIGAPAPAVRPIPRKSSPDARCAEIIARVSLGEELSASDRAMLKGECRR